jgi:hypothetical protein
VETGGLFFALQRRPLSCTPERNLVEVSTFNIGEACSAMQVLGARKSNTAYRVVCWGGAWWSRSPPPALKIEHGLSRCVLGGGVVVSLPTARVV